MSGPRALQCGLTASVLLERVCRCFEVSSSAYFKRTAEQLPALYRGNEKDLGVCFEGLQLAVFGLSTPFVHIPVNSKLKRF